MVVDLRDHPLMSYRGVRNWPPTWTKTGGSPDLARETLHGEIGTLDQVLLSRVDPYTRCYLMIEFNNELYMGTLLFEDAAFCRQFCEFLQHYVGKSIREIGSLSVSHML